MVDQLNDVASKTKGIKGVLINVAIGYGGRSEIADAVKSIITSPGNADKNAAEIAGLISVDEIGRHLYTAGLPDPDLVIRTSGEQRLGGFLLWQSAHSEFYFCEAYWPDFRRVDFLRAIRAYSQRNRRFGK
jgi:short-chain Z-isoprenyl diphosphate synthase